MLQLDRITMNPQVMGGKPCIRGMRVTAGTIVGLIAAGRGSSSRSPVGAEAPPTVSSPRAGACFVGGASAPTFASLTYASPSAPAMAARKSL